LGVKKRLGLKRDLDSSAIEESVEADLENHLVIIG